jgi:hypothetical protein
MGNTLYVANTLGHTIAAINVANDAQHPDESVTRRRTFNRCKSGPARWGIVSGQNTNTPLNGRETGHGCRRGMHRA